MAITAPHSFSISLPSRRHHAACGSNAGKPRGTRQKLVMCSAKETSGAPPFQRPMGTPGVDTRIHWDNPDEGWLGVGSGANKAKEEAKAKEDEVFGEKFADLLNNSTDSYYQFLGVSAAADTEQIKAAYRRLSKEYHPDTTSLPLKVASEKFMQLREVYDVLSDEEKRQFYDWTLAQQVASRKKERMSMSFEDPYQQDVDNWVHIPDTVDRLGGKNMKLSDQAMTALTFDVGIIFFTIACIGYYIFFKEPY